MMLLNRLPAPKISNEDKSWTCLPNASNIYHLVPGMSYVALGERRWALERNFKATRAKYKLLSLGAAKLTNTFRYFFSLECYITKQFN